MHSTVFTHWILPTLFRPVQNCAGSTVSRCAMNPAYAFSSGARPSSDLDVELGGKITSRERKSMVKRGRAIWNAQEAPKMESLTGR